MITKMEEDTILIQKILNGNQESQRILYEKYRKIIKDFIRCKYSFYYDIDDDVQEILIKLFSALNTFDYTQSKFKSWVLCIAKNHMVDRWRDNSMKLSSFNNTSISTTQIDGQFDDATATSTEWSSVASNTASFDANGYFSSCSGEYDNCNSINYLSSQLSAADYALLDMKYLQGYSYCEIGKEFNLTSNTVSNKVNYIKSKLKKNYSEMMDE